MRFGLNFFPSVDPAQLSGQDYYRQALALAARADALGYHHIRTVEHYFRGYGGYSPSPIVFLTAVAQRTQRVRLVTGAVLPAFNHPIKLAAELAMLDCLSDGRLDAGFARAFLPEEFDAFQVPMGESRAAWIIVRRSCPRATGPVRRTRMSMSLSGVASPRASDP